jgi:putative transposase
MRVQRAYKTELDLNDQQVTACKQHAGAALWAYNWGLQVKQERYNATKTSPTAIDLHREINALKKTQVPWLHQVSKCAPQEALWNLDAAFQQFFRRCGWVDADLTLSDRTFHCEQCGLVLDRDLNAAINLEKLADSSPDSLNACGAASSGTRSKPRVQLAAKK